MKTLFIVIPFLLGSLIASSPAQDFDKIQVQTHPLAENVYLIASRAGGNLVACVGADGVFLVDSEYTELSGKVRAALAKITDQPVRFVFNTHWHFDHVGGNAAFAKEGAVIVAHENVRARMAVDQHIAIIEVNVPASPKEALPEITFLETISFHFNGGVIKAFHPEQGHTDGDGVVHFEGANVIHLGDLVFYPGYPFIDLSGGGSIDGVIAAVEAILKMCDENTRIVPGHGPVMNRDQLEEYGEMLRAFRKAIAKEIEAGKTLAAIQAARPTAKLDKQWGRYHFPPERFTEIVYRSLMGK